MQAVGSPSLSLTSLQQMFGLLQNDITSLTGQFASEAIGSSANTTGSSAASSTSGNTSTTASTPTPTTPSSQFSSDTLAALIQNQTQPSSWASNEANTILSADGGNGEISLAQVTSAMQASGSSDSTSQITSAFNQMDTNGDGELSQSELTSALQQMQQSQGGGGHHHHHRVSGSSGSSSSSTSSSTTATDALGVPVTSSSTATSTGSIFSTATSS